LQQVGQAYFERINVPRGNFHGAKIWGKPQYRCCARFVQQQTRSCKDVKIGALAPSDVHIPTSLPHNY
jgi:hypothetical protein